MSHNIKFQFGGYECEAPIDKIGQFDDAIFVNPVTFNGKLYNSQMIIQYRSIERASNSYSIISELEPRMCVSLANVTVEVPFDNGEHRFVLDDESNIILDELRG